MPSRDDVIAETRTWLEVPWVHQGRSRQGIDCAGLVVVVSRALSLADHDEVGYQRRPNGYNFMRPFCEHMDRKSIADMAPGDVMLFRDGAFPCHVAILSWRLDHMTIIHAHATRKKVLEEPIEQGDWLDRSVACFAFRGIN